MRENWS